jgi:copper homeostasis protein
VTLLEVCLDDIEGAIVAERHGADRIELCAGLVEDGTTPSIGTVQTVLRHVRRIGVQVLVRQRGGEFVYSDAEVDAMCADVEAIRALPVPAGVRLGFVIGALRPDGTIDRDATARMLAVCGDAPVTFPKACDATPDLDAALDVLIELGLGRVLTSGGAATALDGADSLARLVARSAGRIGILAAGGIRPHNAAEVVARTGVAEVHLRAAAPAATTERADAAPTRPATSGTIIDGMLQALAR